MASENQQKKEMLQDTQMQPSSNTKPQESGKGYEFEDLSPREFISALIERGVDLRGAKVRVFIGDKEIK